ncbi:hypothetical protein TNCV_376451 [Trichonephila clavipes]|nr:hypothetical protein TNCV_376451 [Trichonephila clavipes]
MKIRIEYCVANRGSLRSKGAKKLVHIKALGVLWNTSAKYQLGKHYYAASESTDHDVVGDETENNSANPQSWPKSIKSGPNSPVASTSKDGVIRCAACEEEYCDPPAEE